MEIKTVLKKEYICILKNNTKKETLLEIIGLLEKSGAIKNIEKLKEGIFYREGLLSTGIGLGIAIPHVRIEGVRQPIMAVEIKREGIKDYESIDDKIVWIVIMIVAGKEQHREYIRLLSKIVAKLKSGKKLEDLQKANNPEEIYNIFVEKRNL
jgi:mannitol/fructose-specific phosphotransferase system IIA component (Ntr-type)